MRKAFLAMFGLVPCILLQPAKTQSAPQDDSTQLRLFVVLVQLSIAVTDGKGNYVNGLRLEDFEVTEDKIPQKISSFEEGSGSPAAADPQNDDQPQISRTAVSADAQAAEPHVQAASAL